MKLLTKDIRISLFYSIFLSHTSYVCVCLLVPKVIIIGWFSQFLLLIFTPYLYDSFCIADVYIDIYTQKEREMYTRKRAYLQSCSHTHTQIMEDWGSWWDHQHSNQKHNQIKEINYAMTQFGVKKIFILPTM